MAAKTMQSSVLSTQTGSTILLFILPLVAVRLALQPVFPLQHDWANFISFGVFFVLGYLVFTDERFTSAIRRDWWILSA